MNLKQWRAARRKQVLKDEGLHAWHMPGAKIPSKKHYTRKRKHKNEED